MMNQSLGMVELNSISRGIAVSDAMAKASKIEIATAASICPGKFIVIISGDVAAVENSIAVGVRLAGEFIIDYFVLPRVHAGVFPALTATSEMPRNGSLGIIEGFSAASVIIAADTALKAARVDAVELRIGSGLGGKAYFILSGDLGSVTKAVEAGRQSMEEKGLLINTEVISVPAKALWDALM